MSRNLDPSASTAAWDLPAGSRLEDSPGEPRPQSAAPGGVPLFSFGPWLWASFGVLLAMLLTLSGAGLLFFFDPSDGAKSLVDLEQATGFGFLRDVHFWAGQGLLIAAWLHLTRVFAAGSYRRRLGWRVTVSLVLLVTLEAWLGGLLARAPASPQGGSQLAAFAAHILIVPAVIAGLVALWKRRRVAVLVAAIGDGADAESAALRRAETSNAADEEALDESLGDETAESAEEGESARSAEEEEPARSVEEASHVVDSEIGGRP